MKEKGFAPILILVGILILAAVGGGAYYLGIMKVNNSKNQVKVSYHQPSVSTTPKIITEVPVLTLDYSKITVKPITIKTTMNLSDLRYALYTAKGHYLFSEEIGSASSVSGRYAHKLIYDGNIISTGQNIDIGWAEPVLSHNGLHYAYAINDDANTSGFVFVDGQKKASAPSNILSIAVTDDGQHVFYAYAIALPTDPTGKQNTTFLMEDGSQLYSTTEDGYGQRVQISPNGDNYFYGYASGAVHNGKPIDLSSIFTISPNGEHYAFVGTDTYQTKSFLSIDGQVKIIPYAGDITQLTSSGHYVFTTTVFFGRSPNTSLVFVDGNPLDVSIKQAIITDDAKHMLTQDINNNWKFDNKPIQLINAPDRIEIDGTIIYTYSVTN